MTAPATRGGARAEILALCAAVFAGASAMRGLDAALPQLAASFGGSVGASSLVITAYAVAYGSSQFVFGPLGDRAGLYRVVRLACLASTGMTVACALAPSLPWLVGFRALAGVAAASIGPLSVAWISGVTSDAERPVVIARTTSASVLGMLAGQVGGGLLVDVLGWRAIFGAIALLFATVSAALISSERRAPARPLAPEAGRRRRGPLDLVQSRDVQGVLAAVAAEGFAMYMSFPYVAASLQKGFNIGSGASGLLLTLFGAGGLLFLAAAKPVMAASSEAARAVLGGALVGAGYAAVALGPSVVLDAAALVAMGFGLFMLHNLLQVAATRMAPDARGAAVAMFASVFFLAQAVGTPFGGLVYDRAGPAALFLLSGAALVALGVAIGASRRVIPAPPRSVGRSSARRGG